jgi:hypothetical protein
MSTALAPSPALVKLVAHKHASYTCVSRRGETLFLYGDSRTGLTFIKAQIGGERFPLSTKSTPRSLSLVRNPRLLGFIRVFNSPAQVDKFIERRFAYYDSDPTAKELAKEHLATLKQAGCGRPLQEMNRREQDDHSLIRVVYDLMIGGNFRTAYEFWRRADTLVRDCFPRRTVAAMRHHALLA